MPGLGDREKVGEEDVDVLVLHIVRKLKNWT